jgi:hypothetical protein
LWMGLKRLTELFYFYSSGWTRLSPPPSFLIVGTSESIELSSQRSLPSLSEVNYGEMSDEAYTLHNTYLCLPPRTAVSSLISRNNKSIAVQIVWRREKIRRSQIYSLVRNVVKLYSRRTLVEPEHNVLVNIIRAQLLR